MNENKSENKDAVLSEVDKLKEEFRQFTYIVSHDLNGPLRTIVAFTKLIEEHCGDKLDERALHYLSFITSSGEKAQSLLTALLQYSRLETIERKPQIQNTPKLLEEVVLSMKEEIKKTGTLIQVGELPPVYGDLEQLKQAFQAVISNSIKYHRPDAEPEIEIGGKAEGGKITFTIKDNGIGIDPKFHADIFKVFRRLHRDEEYPGTGIGLAVLQKIMKLHNGTVSLESAPNSGTKFLLTFPEK